MEPIAPQYDPESLMTPQELADILRVPRGTLANWRSKDQGPPFIKLGRHVRYPWECVTEWINSQEVHLVENTPSCPESSQSQTTTSV